MTVIRVLTGAVMAAALAAGQPGPGAGPGPGPRPLRGLTPGEMETWLESMDRFREVDSVSGTEPGAEGSGLGPRFNMNSCAGCHAHPTLGGSSPPVNPQIEAATRYGARNAVPSFLSLDGPVRVARFRRGPNGPDGGVHPLFVITGRADAGTCEIAQPDFAGAVAQNNVVFRIPTPVFGAGLIESIPDEAILANKGANQADKARLGIRGRENRNASDGTITRFGWKAQNKSLQIFAGEAYNVEQGVSNELFPNETAVAPGCNGNGTPEDHTRYDAAHPLEMMSDTVAFALFMRMLAPPPPVQDNPAVNNGRNVFQQVGCALCHTATLMTGESSITALSHQRADLYSDLLLHDMGPGLADGVRQGDANGGDWRTAPLWGVGQRLFYLHDGRTNDLVEAIRAHASPGSEARQVIAAFDALPPQARQDLLAFLKAL